MQLFYKAGVYLSQLIKGKESLGGANYKAQKTASPSGRGGKKTIREKLTLI